MEGPFSFQKFELTIEPIPSPIRSDRMKLKVVIVMYKKNQLNNQFAFDTLRFEGEPVQDSFIAISVFPTEVSEEFGPLVDEYPK